MKSCTYCSNAVEESYCSKCGQKYYDIPFTFKHVRTLISDSFDFNRGFFITFYHMLVNPRLVITTYLAGNSKTYVSPLKYLLLIVAVHAITSDLEEFLTYAIAFGVTLYVWATNSLLFRKPKHNAIEHLIIVLYTMCEFCALIGPTMIIHYLSIRTGIVSEARSNEALMLIYFSLIWIYHIYFSMRVFDGKSVILFLKSMVPVFLLWCMLAVIIGVSDGL